ncbi:putative calcium-binding protein CML19 [Arachis stenosperma]|uniref:putative calcium-binding protein CML19 n=1 Tax=Arachis stenosperma TaxID=217475 RepID=UPI0025AD8EE3|nr:putative calcium-binding protein CML19 [Arachis stenosperma]
MKYTQFERVLGYFDEDGDGKISASELRSQLGKMSGEILLEEEMEMAIAALDSDGDGLLSLEDMMNLMEGGEEDEKLKDLKEAFEMYDTDRCGFITPKGLRRMLKKLGESMSVEECQVMISRFDLNGDGMLSFEEFRIMMQ